ncbi:MAG TPA: rhodanese-like domain-containing protein [Desulfohalobiaceae bacterium]|nr:rhodanese-like domain-containing protein [Desulfohalobiaceae bacterium]
MSKEKVLAIEPYELQKLISSQREDSYIIIDVRQPEEYTTDHIPGSLHIPLPELENNLQAIPENQDLIFYCRSGRRSLAGATLVTDRKEHSHKRILNLQGGIMAWNGKKLEGMPKFQVIDPKAKFEEILYQAINMEKGAWIYYTRLAHHFSYLTLASTITQLADMETKHAQTIYEILSSKRPELQPFEKLFEELAGDIIEGGESLEELLKRISEIEEGGCLTLAEIALDIEYTAYDLYRTLGNLAQEKDQQWAFFQLAEQEKGHIRILAKGLPECVSQEFKQNT